MSGHASARTDSGSPPALRLYSTTASATVCGVRKYARSAAVGASMMRDGSRPCERVSTKSVAACGNCPRVAAGSVSTDVSSISGEEETAREDHGAPGCHIVLAGIHVRGSIRMAAARRSAKRTGASGWLNRDRRPGREKRAREFVVSQLRQLSSPRVYWWVGRPRYHAVRRDTGREWNAVRQRSASALDNAAAAAWRWSRWRKYTTSLSGRSRP